MKNKKRLVIAFLILILAFFVGFITYSVLTDDNKLSVAEKSWINKNINTVQNINVLNDVNIFGNTGTGVFYEFINDLKLEYKLQINPITFNLGEKVNGLALDAKNELNKNDSVFYQDHYVLVSKNNEIVADYSNFAGKKIGVLNKNTSYISSYLGNVNELSLTGYENKLGLLEAFSEAKDIEYMIVPLTIYLDEILAKDYYIVNHLSDVKFYYTINSNDDALSKILNKFYNNWYSTHLKEYFKREEFKLFTTSLGITETEIDALRSVTYKYGFINNSPYEVIMSGNYGGIIAMYLDEFSSFGDLEFSYKKYNNLNKFKNAIKNEELDLYFNYYGLMDKYNAIDSHILAEYSVIAKNENRIVINSFNSLIGKTVYVEENSFIMNYLNTIKGINIKTYKTVKDLKKLNKKDEIIVIDKNVYNLYAKDILLKFSERYSTTLNDTYDFKTKNNSAFYKLMTKYAMILDNNEMIYKGLYSHSLTVKTGGVLGSIAKYILLTLAAFGVLFIIFYRSSKRIKVAKRIRRENKMKFIDQLTTLKNRNYLNEYINNWNNNTIYPQTMIVIDLNNIQFINDTLGYEEGDKQIKAAANILIKTQLDNSDIMRTDGNEFLIYLVGYTQKQVTNYIHKINKEFKKLPYEYGAEFGYSMIIDSIKTIEDAIIEATEEMRNQKKKSGDGIDAREAKR